MPSPAFLLAIVTAASILMAEAQTVLLQFGFRHHGSLTTQSLMISSRTREKEQEQKAHKRYPAIAPG